MRALVFIVVFALALPLIADTIYDPYGRYKGLLDDKGRFFDSHSGYKGKLTTEGGIYSPYGKFLGTIEPNGKIYDPHSRYKGQLNQGGKYFDSTGNFGGTISR